MRAGAEIEIRLTLIRHGAAKSNLEHRYLGAADEALSAEGVEYLMQRRESGCYPKAERVFTSPMLRCRQTAEILFPKAEICVISDWTEMDFGLFEGKNYEELAGDIYYQKWVDSGGTLPFPGGESRRAFVRRTMRGFEEMMSLQRGWKKEKGQRQEKEQREEEEQSEEKEQGEQREERGQREKIEQREEREQREEKGQRKERGQKEAGEQKKQIDRAEIVAVVHGGTIMALCSSLFGGEYFDYQVGCGEGFASCFRYTNKGIELLELRKV